MLANAARRAGEISAQASHRGRNMTFDARNIPIPIAGGTVGSHTGTGTGSTRTRETIATGNRGAEAARRANTPQARMASEATERQKKDREAAQRASVSTPGAGLLLELSTMKTDHADLVTRNGGPTGTTLKTDFEFQKRAFEAEELRLAGDPSDTFAQQDFSVARNAMRKAEKDLKDHKEGTEKIEKLEEKIEKYRAL